ncbi:hypothetical protein LOTGIDRAFT_156130 [Lottia gigantea]|uniref:Uncharacterized protein n=1 Tax=Lottia gigantea TaxID=225164 RepID=V4BBH2_LOTGI|nr:hypothetical protein LOTGIDRAFT_156130 [Lottia gigantea]ESP04891.1 hypothetical protein LOTGIDRAFT_156130 [Lottia gigantea]
MAVQLGNGHTASVLCLDVQRQTEQLASGGENGELCVWALESKSLLKKYVKADCECTSVCFSKTNLDILYAAFEREVFVFDINDFEEPILTYSFNSEEINQIALSNQEEYLAACDDSGDVKIINLPEKKMYKTLRNIHSNICATISFRPNRPQDLVSGGMDGKLVHWLYPNHKCLNEFNMRELLDTPEDASAYMVNPPFIHHVACSPTGTYIACALQNGQILVFNGSRKNLSQLFTLHAHTQGVSQVVFCDETHLISGGNDCQLILEQSISHPMKINWLQYYCKDGVRYLLVADQTMCISVIPLL